MEIIVRNGTSAGGKKGREQSRAAWMCPNCGAHNRYYWIRCPVCAHPRL